MGERPHKRGFGRLGPTYERWVLPVVGVAIGGALAAWLLLNSTFYEAIAATIAAAAGLLTYLSYRFYRTRAS